ncbi:hypothetical protein SZ54_1903 [Rhizobium sp. UR51a]|nr:hypothetical protein SZ54_1903 [Rhizobium sp. UR51a]
MPRYFEVTLRVADGSRLRRLSAAPLKTIFSLIAPQRGTIILY